MKQLILTAALAFLAACGSGHAGTRPHIILITSDALRADHLSVNGYPRETSPALNEFAKESLYFDDAVTVIPKTGPALTTMFTGRHPQEHGVRSNFEAIPESLPVLAERLRKFGYRTAAFVGNPVLRPTKGYARGFDHYQLFDGRRGEGVSSLNAAFRKWAHGNTWDQPNFIWIHYMDPHGPYHGPPEIRQRFLDDALASSDARVPLEPSAVPSGDRNKVLGALPAYQRLGDEDRVAVYVARYDAEIRYMDAAFGELMEFLRTLGLFDGSAIIFTADHGESLGEHNFYFEHGWFAYEPTLRIPLMIKRPGQTEGETVSQQVSNLDFLRTVLTITGVSVGPEVSGRDLCGALPQSQPVLLENADRYPDKYHGVRVDGWKYLKQADDGAEELYSLRDDPGELRNLAEAEPERLSELREAFEEALSRARAAAVPEGVGLPDDPATVERLEALGYVE